MAAPTLTRRPAEAPTGPRPLRRVAIFQKGEYRGKEYTAGDLRDIVRNFTPLSTGPNPKIPVSTVLGHEEEQGFLKDPRFFRRTDLPSVGWPDRIYTDGATLFADWDRPSALLRKLLTNRAYRTVSSEIYDQPPAGLPGTGKVLRRVALLGGDVPEVKTLGDVLKATDPDSYSERFAGPAPATLRLASVTRLPGGAWACFSEVVPMDREAMLTKLAEHGVDPGEVAGSDDKALTEHLRSLDAKDQGAPPPESYDEEPGDVPEDKRAEFAERARKMMKYAEKCMSKYSDKPVGDLPASPTGPAGTSPEELKKYCERLVSAALAPLGDRVAQIDRFTEERAAADKRALILTRLKTLRDQGKVLPAELDGGLVDAAYGIDATRVEKFSEGGKAVEMTALERFFRALESRPVLARFTERTRSGPGGKPVSAEDDEVAKVEQHFDSFAESFEGNGTSKEQMVAAFKGQRKRVKGLTAEQFLGTRETA